MLVNIKQAGYTIVELLVATAVAGIVSVAVLSVMLSYYGGIVASHDKAALTLEAQTILSTIAEELRVSSGVRSTNQLPDANEPSGGWTTDNNDHILIISTPAIQSTDNEFVTSPITGAPYQNELIYYTEGDTLFRRVLANENVDDNQLQTSCPVSTASSTCPRDAVLSRNFQDMSFVFYDQNGNETTNQSLAKSIELIIDMAKTSFGKENTAQNRIRMTLRNTTP